MANKELMEPAWLSKVMGREVESASWDEDELDKLNKNTSMRWATVQFSDKKEETMKIVLKTAASNEGNSKLYGLAREGYFYAEWQDLLSMSTPADAKIALSADDLKSVLPVVYHSKGNMETGAKEILLEDLSTCVQCGYFYGAANPNNWGKDLEGACKGLKLTPDELTKICFSAASKLHAPFWNSTELLQYANKEGHWLRASNWTHGQGKETWEGSQTSAKRAWVAFKESIVKNENKVTCEDHFIACMDAALQKVNWDTYQAELKKRPCGFTLTHGDFHPANFMVRKHESGSHSVVLLDWEMVGLGSGPQELGQFMISHLDPTLRKTLEREAVEHYYKELTSYNGGISFSFEECWEEYLQGGLGRWMWFVPVLISMCPPKMGQFFVDQVQAFINTHNFNPENIPMPRS
eukprot:m.65000 g.65000  ORF g.65000 m.65000 type:complete len:408 (+) comp11693_c0_seq1:108-1331(+)